MRTLSRNKLLFLTIVKNVNDQLEDVQLSQENALKMYEKEISPYGYPTHQSILINYGMGMYHFNREIVTHKLKDDNDVALRGEGFGLGKVICPTYYITDDLANSLVETETPKNIKDIDLEILPTFQIVFSKKFNHFNTVGIVQLEDGIDVHLDYRYVPADKDDLIVDIPMKFFIPYNGDGHCMFCDTREYFAKNLLKRNYYKLRVANRPVNDDKFYVAKLNRDNQLQFIFREWSHEPVEKCIERFLQEDLHKAYRFVINLLCLMTQQPDIISVQNAPSNHGFLLNSNKGFGSEKVNNVPNVHWLGENFTTRVVDSTPASEDTERTRGKPKKSHWRRGHWHTVLQGPGRTQKQLKWFRPTFIRGHAS